MDDSPQPTDLAPVFTAADETQLREALKRCPPATAEAACQFRRTGNRDFLPPIIFGVIARYVETRLRPMLEAPSDELRLREDLGLDSLTMMEIVLLTEDVLGITVSNEELTSLRTLGDVRQFIVSKVSLIPFPLAPSQAAANWQ